MELAGTGLAGVLIAWLGIYGALLVDASCFLIAALLILPLGLPEELQSQQAESYGKTLKEGISFLRDSRRLLLLILLCGLLNAMLTPMQALQSALVKDIYQKGGETLSFMGAALSGGMLLGAFLYPFLAKRVAIDKALLLCGILNGGFYLVLAGCALISQNIFLPRPGLFITGFRGVHRLFKHGAGCHDHESDTDSLYVQGNRAGKCPLPGGGTGHLLSRIGGGQTG